MAFAKSHERVAEPSPPSAPRSSWIAQKLISLMRPNFKFSAVFGPWPLVGGGGGWNDYLETGSDSKRA